MFAEFFRGNFRKYVSPGEYVGSEITYRYYDIALCGSGFCIFVFLRFSWVSQQCK